jgi:hypothetical protein
LRQTLPRRGALTMRDMTPIVALGAFCWLQHARAPARKMGIRKGETKRASRFPRKERLHMPGSLTTPGRPGARADAPEYVAFRHMHGVGTQNRNFRGSMAGLRAPLSTLRRGPHGQPRMTRGRCGSLLLHRKGLAPSTPCRSPGASHMFSGVPPIAAGSEPCQHLRSAPKAALREFPRSVLDGRD